MERIPGSWPPQFVWDSIPESHRAPLGPYRQAPPEYGGAGWFVSWTTGETPWINQGKLVEPPSYPEGFIDTFGPRPLGKDYPKLGVSFQQALSRWQDDLKYFKEAGVPEWHNPVLWQDAAQLFSRWGMGHPRPHLGRYDYCVRWPDSQNREFEGSYYEAQNSTHLVIARYQMSLLSVGVVPDGDRHPFVPPDMWPE